MKSKKQKLDKPLTYSCSFDECDSAIIERICKIRNKIILDIAYRGINKYVSSLAVPYAVPIEKTNV